MTARKALEQTLQKITLLAEKVAEPLGLEVVDVRFGQQGKVRSLEVTIFKRAQAVSLADCEQVSRQLEELIETESQANQEPVIEGAYVLEVQSPGLERQLKTEREFRIFCGHQVIVQTRSQVDGLGVRFTGVLQSGDQAKVTLTDAQPVQPKKNEKILQPRVTIEATDLVQVKLYPDYLYKKGKDN